ncbi:MAG: putative transcriptional regulator [Marmoricola sp.]|nr:putative transcriptional regulator [Marmoricola sp.]
MERSFVRPTPEGLKALSHPGRLRMLGLLRSDGPATATTLAVRLGLNSGATSYHLRQLEKHGFVVEDTERGNARDRWWRAAHQSTHTDSADMTTPEEHDTYDAYLQSVVMFHDERMQRSLEERRLLPAAWRDAGDLSDWSLRLTAQRAQELVLAVHELIDGFGEDADDDPGAAPYVLNLNAFVRPGVIGLEEEET